jgi:alpha-ketoglutarate-dependent taurine dioxygenase
LQDDTLYRRWRDWKLDSYPATADALVVEVADANAPSRAEIEELLRIIRKTNMVIYSCTAGKSMDKALFRTWCGRFGLRHLDSNMLADDDGITSLQVVPGKSTRGYIPYSNQRLLWHTDGYYNTPAHTVRAIALHCVSPAAEGGSNELLDPEIAYILLRDANPDYLRALLADDAMTVPANMESGSETRAAQSGPVFSVDPATGSLHMRYTARTRSIEWKPDADTGLAVGFLQELLTTGSRYLYTHRLEAGQGLLCNNVLHNRTGFTDAVDKGRQRLLYRARYFDRIAHTHLNEIFDLSAD